MPTLEYLIKITGLFVVFITLIYSGANKFKRGHILRRISVYYFKLKEKEMRF